MNLIDEAVKHAIDQQNALIDADLVKVVESSGEARPDVSVVWQVPPYGPELGGVYRGIALAGVMVVDHHPEWGELDGIDLQP